MNNELQDILRAILKEELEPIKEEIRESRKELNDFKQVTTINLDVLSDQIKLLTQKVDQRFDATGEVIAETIYETRELSEKVEALAGLYGKVETNINVLSNKFNKTNRIQ